MLIKDLQQPEMLSMLESTNEQNRRLIFPAVSRIPIFNFFNLRDNPDRECSISLDEEGMIRGIAMYRYRSAQERGFEGEDYTFISLGVDEALRGQKMGTTLLDHVLAKMRQRVQVVSLQILPEDITYQKRWTEFLERKFAEHNLTLRHSLF